jgi:hypothetical protein
VQSTDKIGIQEIHERVTAYYLLLALGTSTPNFQPPSLNYLQSLSSIKKKWAPMRRFVLEATIGCFKKASSGHYLTETPTGRFYEASSGCLSQLAPTAHFLLASSGRFCQVATVGCFQKAFSGRPLDALVPSGSHCPTGALKHICCVQRVLLKCLLDAFTRKRPADWQVF